MPVKMQPRMSWCMPLACAVSLLLLGSAYALSTRSQVISIQAAKKKVSVQFIGESLCPDCAALTLGPLNEIFGAGLDKFIDLDYVAWGNAKNSSGKVACQHGPRECELNKALNCAQRLAASQAAFFKFLYCLESTAFGTSSEGVLRSCSGDAALDVHALRECTYGNQGDKLERAAALATPKHGYVPWILVDGVPLGADCGNLLSYICTAIGGSKPDTCYEVPKFQACPGAPTDSA